MQPNKGKGNKTTTHHINGETYQVRRLTCGNRDRCNVCKNEGGHVAVYQDLGMVDGKRKWQSVGKLPDPDPDYVPATCQREGCTNPTPRRGQKYCSATCRVAANRANKL